jgi:hypothetical protein
MMMAIAVKRRAIHGREWGRKVEADAWEGAGGKASRQKMKAAVVWRT